MDAWTWSQESKAGGQTRVSLPVRDPPETGKISGSRNYPGLETARIFRKISPKFKIFKKICMNGNRCIPSGNRRFPTGFR